MLKKNDRFDKHIYIIRKYNKIMIKTINRLTFKNE